MSYQIVDEIRSVGLQNYNVYENLNPIEINIRDNEIQGKLSRYDTNDLNIALLLIVYSLVHQLYKIQIRIS